MCIYTRNPIDAICNDEILKKFECLLTACQTFGWNLPWTGLFLDADDLKIGIIWGTVLLELISCIFFVLLDVLLAVQFLVLFWEPKIFSEFSFEFVLFNVFKGVRSWHNELLPITHTSAWCEWPFPNSWNIFYHICTGNLEHVDI